MISGHRGLEINEILQVIPRVLAELAQMFHDYHCPSRQWIAGLSNLPRQSSVCLSRCFLFRFSFPLLPADSSFSVKRLLLQTSIILSFSVSVCVFSSAGCF